MLNKHNDYKNLPRLTIFNQHNNNRLEDIYSDEYAAFCEDVCDYIFGGECVCGNCGDALDIGVNPAANTIDGGAGLLDALDALTSALFVVLGVNSTKIAFGKNKQYKMMTSKSDLRKFRSWGGAFKAKVDRIPTIDQCKNTLKK